MKLTMRSMKRAIAATVLGWLTAFGGCVQLATPRSQPDGLVPLLQISEPTRALLGASR